MDISDSFDANDDRVASAPAGQRGHRTLIEHGARFERRLWPLGDRAWSLVGNGLSNQNFIAAPQGLIVIDTGDSIQEMSSAMADLRAVCQAPVAGVVYSHFHYVAGTRALLPPGASAPDFPIWSHARVPANRLRIGAEVNATAARGLIHQFGMALPAQGEDGLINVGLGMAYRNPAHAPHTAGYIAPTDTFDSDTTVTIAGLELQLLPAPSDADDSITIWCPSLGLCVNNLVWPALFNVFPIRGEEYRDPRILLRGLDRILELAPQFLAGAHGPPIVGREKIRDEVTRYRDSIQFLWDQTVRAMNRGLAGAQLSHAIRLPEQFSKSYLTQQLYGLVEHHLRQIQTGLTGWFDGDPANLFPVEPRERARRLIGGFGGADAVHDQAQRAIEQNDLRWALELSGWLVSADEARAADGRALLARALRRIAQRTTAANIRNWCLTRALELEGRADLSRYRVQRFRAEDVLASPPRAYVDVLRVMLDPQRAQDTGFELRAFELRWAFDDGEHCGLRLRNQVAVATDGSRADASLALTRATWAQIVAGKLRLSQALADGTARLSGDRERILAFLACFDLPSLKPIAA